MNDTYEDLKRERDAAIAAKNKAIIDSLEIINELAKLRTQVEALKKFATHQKGCGVYHRNSYERENYDERYTSRWLDYLDPQPCDCGLDALLTPAPSSEEKK